MTHLGQSDSRLPFRLTQDDIDRAARKLAELGYDVGHEPVVEGVGTSPNLRMATYLALKAAEEGRGRRVRDARVTHGGGCDRR